MKDILAEIVEKKRAVVEAAREQMPLDRLKAELKQGTHRAAEVLEAADFSLIAECKLNSPAKGRLCRRYEVTELAKIYSEIVNRQGGGYDIRRICGIGTPCGKDQHNK